MAAVMPAQLHVANDASSDIQVDSQQDATASSSNDSASHAQIAFQQAKQLYLDTFMTSAAPNRPQLKQHLAKQVQQLPPADEFELPAQYTHAGLTKFLTAAHDSVVRRYNQYLDRRRKGGEREMFETRSHAFYFVESVSPTKIVDGSWLYRTMSRRDRPVYHTLQKILIEEAGEGKRHMNHVAMYKSLLQRYALQQDLNQIDAIYFVQGAIQLCLAYGELEDVLPEVVGYNLGYEQLPYHLLVTTHELNELSVDPYYFQLHVTIDNASTGHAAQAIDAVEQLLATCTSEEQRQEYWQRVRCGYALNDLGLSAVQVVQQFDLKRELCKCVASKSSQAFGLHTKMIKIGDLSLNEWLEPERCKDLHHIELMLEAMCDSGYIRRGRPVKDSKFWSYLNAGTSGVMYGVFSEKDKALFQLYIETQPTGTTPKAQLRTAAPSTPRLEYPAPLHIEKLVDKYLGKTLKQHEQVQLPDPDTPEQYISLPKLYTERRDRFLQAFARYTTRQNTANSFCWGAMQRVMPEEDKKQLLEWLDVQTVDEPHIDSNETVGTTIVKQETFPTIYTHSVDTPSDMTIYLNSLLNVIGHYLDPREHWTEQGIVMTALYDQISHHTPLGEVDANLVTVLQTLNYWALLGLAVHTIQSVSTLRNAINVTELVNDQLNTSEDKKHLKSAQAHAARHIFFTSSDSTTPLSTPTSSPLQAARRLLQMDSPTAAVRSMVQQTQWSHIAAAVVPLFTVLVVVPMVRSTILY